MNLEPSPIVDNFENDIFGTIFDKAILYFLIIKTFEIYSKNQGISMWTTRRKLQRGGSHLRLFRCDSHITTILTKNGKTIVFTTKGESREVVRIVHYESR